MKYLTDRQEIARAINFGKHPVLILNMENRPFEESDYARGCNVRIAWDDPNREYEGMTSRGTVIHTEGKIQISGHGTMLKADFGREDVLEMVEWANTPLIHKGDTVVLVQDWPSKKMCTVQLMKMPNNFDKHCMVMATLAPVEE